jgi:hypothetical protein
VARPHELLDAGNRTSSIGVAAAAASGGSGAIERSAAFSGPPRPNDFSIAVVPAELDAADPAGIAANATRRSRRGLDLLARLIPSAFVCQTTVTVTPSTGALVVPSETRPRIEPTRSASSCAPAGEAKTPAPTRIATRQAKTAGTALRAERKQSAFIVLPRGMAEDTSLQPESFVIERAGLDVPVRRMRRLRDLRGNEAPARNGSPERPGNGNPSSPEGVGLPGRSRRRAAQSRDAVCRASWPIRRARSSSRNFR